jgi:ligand-binding SRPBCC domain-containing protein
MSHHLQFEQWVPYPLGQVFAFFSNPENLPRIMPAASATRLDRLTRVPPVPSEEGTGDEAAGIGSLIFTSFRVVPFLPIRARWIARIVEFEWNHYFADVQDKGPFKTWHHRHEFVSEIRGSIEGTLVWDAIEYDVGFGWLGSIVNGLFVRPQMERTFKERQTKLPGLLAQERR